MKISSSKEKILKKIRQALSHSVPLPFPKSEGNTTVFHPAVEELSVQFATEFTRLLGRFAFCINEAECLTQLHELAKERAWGALFCQEDNLNRMLKDEWFQKIKSTDVATCDASITGCEFLIARTGSILLSSAGKGGRSTSVYAPVHICIAYADQLVYDIKESLSLIKDRYIGKLPSHLTFATGPSRTADIEKTLVVGVHGPAEVFVFLIDKRG